jgi:hypothetical protein
MRHAAYRIDSHFVGMAMSPPLVSVAISELRACQKSLSVSEAWLAWSRDLDLALVDQT